MPYLLFIAAVIIAVILIAFFYPFLKAIWIGSTSRRRGRLIGHERVQNNLAALGIGSLKINSPAAIITDEKKQSIKKELDNFATAQFTDETARLDQKFDPKIQEITTEISNIKRRIESINTGVGSSKRITKNVTAASQNSLANKFDGKNYWLMVMFLYGILALLILDSIIFGDWLSQIGVFKKGDRMLGDSEEMNQGLLKIINFKMNYIVGFLIKFCFTLLCYILFI